MVDTFFFFLFPMVAALAARVYQKHPVRNIILAGLIGALLDLDYLIGPQRGLLHNIFVTLILPYAIMLYVFYFNKSYHAKGFAIMLYTFVSNHAYLDWTFGGGISAFYPFLTKYYALNLSLSAEGIISIAGLALILYFASVLLPLVFLDKLIIKTEKQVERFKKLLHPEK